jgi:hypothetical protein
MPVQPASRAVVSASLTRFGAPRESAALPRRIRTVASTGLEVGAQIVASRGCRVRMPLNRPYSPPCLVRP